MIETTKAECETRGTLAEFITKCRSVCLDNCTCLVGPLPDRRIPGTDTYLGDYGVFTKALMRLTRWAKNDEGSF